MDIVKFVELFLTELKKAPLVKEYQMELLRVSYLPTNDPKRNYVLEVRISMFGEVFVQNRLMLREGNQPSTQELAYRFASNMSHAILKFPKQNPKYRQYKRASTSASRLP